MAVPEKILEAAAKVAAGDYVETTVRTLLEWFGAYRRSWRNVKRIRDALDEEKLVTIPDFETEYIDGITILKAKADEALAEGGTQAVAQEETTEQGNEPQAVTQAVRAAPLQQLADAAHRISRLAAANRQPISIHPDATVEQAVTLMLRHDYSQLPVMQSPTARDVRGLISWQSLGSRLAVGRTCQFVRDCMDRHQEIAADASLFDAIKIIAEHDCVIVRAADRTISGIVTAYDISAQFQQLAEPFLLLGDIENHIRYVIGRAFTVEELQQCRDERDEDRTIEDASDLTFGEYVRLLQKEANWAKLNMRIDRATFTAWLDKVREIRNDVMHFDPDPIEPADLRLLTDMARFLSRWQRLTA